jgi:hypothetical protein
VELYSRLILKRRMIVLEMKVFSNQWCKWIDSIIKGGHVEIKINDQVG